MSYQDDLIDKIAELTYKDLQAVKVDVVEDIFRSETYNIISGGLDRNGWHSVFEYTSKDGCLCWSKLSLNELRALEKRLMAEARTYLLHDTFWCRPAKPSHRR